MGSGDDGSGPIFNLVHHHILTTRHNIDDQHSPKSQATKTESTNILSRPVPSNPLSRSLTQAIYPVLQSIASQKSLTPTPRR